MPIESYLENLPEWKDEQKARSLFSSFSQPRSVNPESYDAKLQFWKDHLLNATRLGLCDKSVFRLPESSALSKLFSKEGSKPLGIAHVMSGLATLENQDPSSEASLLYKLARLVITGPLVSGWRWVAGSDEDEDAENAEVVVERGPLTLDCLLKECIEGVLQYHADQKRGQGMRALSYVEFCEIIQESRIQAGWAKIVDVRDFDLIMRHMKKAKKIAVMYNNNKLEECIIKIKLPEETTAIQITQEEANLVRLKVVLNSLENQLKLLADQIESTKNAAKAALRKNDRPLALYELCRSKTLENSRNQRLQASSTISELLVKIDDAQSDKHIFEAYRTGESTLKQILQNNNLSVEKVDDVVLLLQEAFVHQREISTALGQTAITEEFNDEELALELEELTKGLPSPPGVPVVDETVFPPVPISEKMTETAGEEEEEMIEATNSTITAIANE